MPTYLDFDTTKKFRDELLNKNLKVQNGPQSFNANTYDVSSLKVTENKDLGSVDTNRSEDLLTPKNNNTYKPIEYIVDENLNVFARRANLNLYPHFQTNQDHTLISILSTDNFDKESELFRLAANNIKNERNGPIQARIAQNLYSSTLGKVRLLDALDGNSTSLANIVTGKEPLIELNNSITVSNNILGQTFDFVENVAGVQFPWTEIPGDYLTKPKNPLNNKPNLIDSIGNVLGFKNLDSVIRPSELFIQYMGSGQKNTLFDNLSYSKYSPNYNTFTSIFSSSVSLGKPYIGDDTTNDVKRTMSDGNDRVVRGNFYLSLLFDETQARLFQNTKNIGDGGGIAGKLTWISKGSRNKIGLYNKEFSSEASLYSDSKSTDYQFRTGSILDVTQQILDSLPTDSSSRSHVANAIDQTSRVFKEGDEVISKGSAVKYIDKFSQEESGVEYCRVWTKDRSYMNYSDTMKRTGLIRKYNSSVMSTPWNLNIAPISNGNKSFDGSTNMEKYADGFRAKKYMFSIENLAWKTSNKPEFTYNDLPYCERGPNGGRIMWFPPYGLKISEQNGTDWEENTFIGRPEPIFTYQKTKRSANLSFKIVVDHPSILNLLVRDHFKNMSDAEADNYINAFFAGCEDLDFYDLIKRYASLDKTDIEIIKAYLNSGKDPQTIKKYRSRLVPETDPVPATNTSTNVNFKNTLYFNNNIPGNNPNLTTESTFSQTFDKYVGISKSAYISELNKGLSVITGGTWNNDKAHDFEILTSSSVWVPDDATLTDMVNRTNNSINVLFTDATKQFDDYKNSIKTLKENIKNNKVKTVKLTFLSSASAVAIDEYNLKLSYRRSYSIINDFLTQLLITGDVKQSLSKLDWKIDKKNQDMNFTIPFKDLGYTVDGEIQITVINKGETLTGKSPDANLVGEEYKTIDCTNNTLPKNKDLAKTMPAAFRCRQTTITVDYNVEEKTEAKNPTTKVVVDEYVEQIAQKPNIDVLKKVVMKVLSECFYFKKLEEESPLQFSSLKEKLKYFHPAFHSMTPEGLNSRLTFLHQCMRPGDTIPIKGITDVNDLNARNTTFGPPPIIVFRFGDFYNTKAIIRDYNIDYDESVWDLNPEGIGVQPMLATVTLQLSLIGGQGMEQPVNELQNALSSNFFANTEVYDYRATATEDRTKFNKQILGEILSYNQSTTEQRSNDLPNSNKVSQYTYIGNIQTDKNEISYNGLINELYTLNNDFYKSLNNTYLTLTKKYGLKVPSLLLSQKYRTINQYIVQAGTAGEKIIKLFGNYPKGMDNFNIIDNLIYKLKVSISITNITNLLEIGYPLFNSKIEETLKDFLNKTINDSNGILNKLTSLEDIKKLESKRNEIIKITDKLNFIVEVEKDGYIDSDNKGLGDELLNFNGDDLYSNYSSVIDFNETYYPQCENVLDPTLELNGMAFSDDDTKYLISLILSNDNNLDKLFLEFNKTVLFNGTIALNIQDSLLKFLRNFNNDIIINTKKITDTFTSFLPTKVPLVNKELNTNVSLGSDYQFTDDESKKLVNVNLTNQNKTTDRLNFYR